MEAHCYKTSVLPFFHFLINLSSNTLRESFTFRMKSSHGDARIDALLAPSPSSLHYTKPRPSSSSEHDLKITSFIFL